MKDKFDELYKKINKLSTVSQDNSYRGRSERRYYLSPNEEISSPMPSPKKPGYQLDSLFKHDLMRVG